MRVRYRLVRPRRRHRVRWERLALFLCVLALLVGGDLLLRSPLLRLQRVRVVGGPQSLWRLSGARLGTLYWSVRPQQVAAELLRRAPYLRSAAVRQGFPQSLTIRVSYRQAVAAVAGGGGTYYGVDATGRVLGRLAGPGNLPVLAGVAAGQVRPYRDLGPAVAAAAALGHALAGRGLGIAQIAAGRPLAIYLSSGTKVLWPASSNLAGTLAELQAILAAVRAQGAQAASVDLTLPGRPLVVYRK